VFRDNGRAVREMDALKAAEGERAAEALARREAVLADVRRIVTSALAGDFSGRIDESAATDDLRDFVASLNSVMTTVEQGVDETGAVLDGLSNADLSRRVEGQYEGVFERLKLSTNTALDKFSEVVQRLQATSRALKTATGEMLAGSNELSSRTTREAATIEETAAAMEQLSSAVASTADKANEASNRTQAASSLADEGGQVMLKATDAMERISQSSGKISNIIALIDDIAFQTNLLALNASVEAARAGEAGKGFAVVAVEVRRLAQSAAQASSEVKVLIEQSGTEVGSGTKLVAQAAAKLTAILEAVRENSNLMGAVSGATRGQASAIAEINAAIRSMDEITQHNAALVEQNNAAIEQAEAQSVELDRIVAAFQLEAMTPEPAEAPSAVAPEPKSVVHGMRERVQRAAAKFQTHGNAAIDEKDWEEF
jgi:methyl-accepting chemotaxis protein